ncbi:TerB family tellurite resistance protein [Methylobacterium sp. J-076]|uniref:tellurite resistance TerB family protein n=1 Tax=Methylobacterium sp. J-076 TaxID=2836655 RepID=UPI001FBAC4D5|nr:TerB family tellurite resistance protein [Methylobacterium sp. J-076]MCJ2015342.1 TerB family tellurite resistance protein [Methylobacterium sp. J-076]
MSLIARLRAYAVEALGIGGPDGRGDAADDTHLAATALLVHVARVDGILAPSESERLARLVEGRYADGPAAAHALIARATAIDTEVRDVASLVEMIPHEANGSEREALLAMAWSVAAADGHVDEFEEALVERLGRLLGFDEAGIAAARQTGTAGAATP